MSQVSTYVKLADGKWYQNPVLKIPNEKFGFICFDDEDPPELVTFNILNGYHSVGKMLEDMGIKARLRSGTMASQRQRLGGRKFAECATWWLDFVPGSRVDPSWVAERDEVFDTEPSVQGVFMDWSGKS